MLILFHHKNKFNFQIYVPKHSNSCSIKVNLISSFLSFTPHIPISMKPIFFYFIAAPIKNTVECQFLVTPENQKVIEGDSVIFRCKAENNNDDLTYTWTFNGKENCCIYIVSVLFSIIISQ